jgi:hypothetical protein
MACIYFTAIYFTAMPIFGKNGMANMLLYQARLLLFPLLIYLREDKSRAQ